MAHGKNYMLRKSVGGFSLMELLVVIAILALIAGVTAARLSGPGESIILKTEARKIIAHLRAIRSKAIGDSVVYSIEAEGGHGYAILPGEQTVMLPEPLTLTLSMGQGSPGQVQLTPSIAFYPDGSASGGMIILGGSDSERIVTVNWMTGEVTLAPDA